MDEELGERMIDFALEGIAGFAFIQAHNKFWCAPIRVLWGIVHFPWVIITAPIWLPIEFIGIFIFLFTGIWRGEL